MTKRFSWSARILSWVIIFVWIACLPVSFAEELSEADIEQFRQARGIPDAEQAMSIEEVIGRWNRDVWVRDALQLRCRLADDTTRKEIYNKVAELAIATIDLPVSEDSRAVNALTFLGQQLGHRDEAVQEVLRVLDVAPTLRKDRCYSALGDLGGPEAIKTLKDAILDGYPPTFEHGPRTSYFILYNYITYCGPDAAPALVEIDQELGTAQNEKRYWALGRTGNENIVVPYMLEQARLARANGEDFHLNIALKAACAKGQFYSDESRRQIVDALLENIDSPAYNVRVAVAYGLGQIGDSSHLPLLEDLAEDPETRMKLVSGENFGESVQAVGYPVREEAVKAIEVLNRRITAEKEAAKE